MVNGEIVITQDLYEWGAWMQYAERHVGDDTINGVRISTVFLGLDHGHGSKPMWFETMIFGPASWYAHYCRRYATLAEAKAGHANAVQEVLNGKIETNDE